MFDKIWDNMREEDYLTESNAILIYLLSIGLNKTKTDIIQSDIDINALYKLASRHSLTALIGMVLKSNGVKLPEVWEKTISKAQFRYAHFQYETEKLFQWFEENRIWYMPLKGTVLQDYYPKPYMRQKGDADILVDPTKLHTVREHMESLGYSTKEFDNGYHDKYIKEPVCKYEIHSVLVSKGVKGYQYYRNIKERLLPIPGTKSGLQFTSEDFYVFLIVHAYKHWNAGGVGFRTLVDIYVWISSHELDWKYIEGELKKMEIFDWEKSIRNLTLKLLSVPSLTHQLTKEEEKLISYIADAGTFGTIENRVKHQDSKLGYFLHRLFPSISYFRERFPCFIPVFLPFYWLYWLMINLVKNTDHAKKEMGAILGIKKSED